MIFNEPARQAITFGVRAAAATRDRGHQRVVGLVVGPCWTAPFAGEPRKRVARTTHIAKTNAATFVACATRACEVRTVPSPSPVVPGSASPTPRWRHVRPSRQPPRIRVCRVSRHVDSQI